MKRETTDTLENVVERTLDRYRIVFNRLDEI